jgi:hypothetical protein
VISWNGKKQPRRGKASSQDGVSYQRTPERDDQVSDLSAYAMLQSIFTTKIEI